MTIRFLWNEGEVFYEITERFVLTEDEISDDKISIK